MSSETATHGDDQRDSDTEDLFSHDRHTHRQTGFGWAGISPRMAHQTEVGRQ